MSQGNRIRQSRHAAHDPSVDRLVTFALRYTMPLAVVAILVMLLVLGWALGIKADL